MRRGGRCDKNLRSGGRLVLCVMSGVAKLLLLLLLMMMGEGQETQQSGIDLRMESDEGAKERDRVMR